MASKSYHLPDTLRSWPWPRSLNPHWIVAQEESVAWVEQHIELDPAARYAFDQCKLGT